MKIKGGPSAPEVKINPRHKKNPAVGDKKTVYSSTIFVEQEDALSFDDQEEVHISVLVYVMDKIIFDLSSDNTDGLG